jgi:hypothetical protein
MPDRVRIFTATPFAAFDSYIVLATAAVPTVFAMQVANVTSAVFDLFFFGTPPGLPTLINPSISIVDANFVAFGKQ